MRDDRSGALAVRLLEGVARRLWGFPPHLMRYVVRELGAWHAVAWFVAHMPRYERTLRVLGPVRCHLACLTISLVNGCRYCTHGHAHALELVYLRERGTLFPVDAATVAGWAGRPPAELRQELAAALRHAGLHLEVMWVDRTLELVSGAITPIEPAEARIAHLVRMFGVLNAVGIRHAVRPDAAHDPVNKDGAVKQRYAALRAGGR